ncbi:MAG: hypothetical protein IT538_08990 [Variibacter sp.]|nr:hypothetical protein [Variibacter sp.]
MTEDEAKTKWCPAVRFVPETNTTHPGTNRGVRIERGAEGAPAFKCIGSACMAWRKLKDGLRSYDGHGYCGLAGKP